MKNNAGLREAAIADSAMAKAGWRIVPLLALSYLIAYMDRVNIGFAATQMNEDLKFSATIYGLGGGFFFLSYSLFEIPSNLLLLRFGARRWIARIMITWGLLAAGMMFVRTPVQFYVLRFLIGMAEAGFFPGVIYYLSGWFPYRYRGRALSRFYLAGPLASVVMGVLSGWLLALDGSGGLRGWQWLFLVQGLPAVGVGLIVLRFLPENPATANWLTSPERDWLTSELAADAARIGDPPSHSVLSQLRHPRVRQLAAISVLTISAFYAFTLSAPVLLKEGTGLQTSSIGYLVSLGGILGALTMWATGWLSDHRGDRYLPLLAGFLAEAVALFTFALAPSTLAVILAYLLFSAAWTAVTLAQVMIWADVFHIRVLAVSSAAINTAAQMGAFFAPSLFGWAHDATGGYKAGLFVLPFACLLALALSVQLRRQVNGSRETKGGAILAPHPDGP